MDTFDWFCIFLIIFPLLTLGAMYALCCIIPKFNKFYEENLYTNDSEGD